jgi:hypothetical protein
LRIIVYSRGVFKEASIYRTGASAAASESVRIHMRGSFYFFSGA